MSRLQKAVAWIQRYQSLNGEVSGWCWRRVRQGCQAAGLRVPTAGSAKEAYKVLSADPEAYGWRRIEKLEEPCLVFFLSKTWDSLALRRFGHAALLSRGVLYASKNYKASAGWMRNLVGIFVPKGD